MNAINKVVGIATLHKWYGIPPHKLRKMVKDGQLKGRKVGNTWVIDSIATLDYVATLTDDEQQAMFKSFIQAGQDLVRKRQNA